MHLTPSKTKFRSQSLSRYSLTLSELLLDKILLKNSKKRWRGAGGLMVIGHVDNTHLNYAFFNRALSSFAVQYMTSLDDNELKERGVNFNPDMLFVSSITTSATVKLFPLR